MDTGIEILALRHLSFAMVLAGRPLTQSAWRLQVTSQAAHSPKLMWYEFLGGAGGAGGRIRTYAI